jgi:hypothetical protein
MKKELNEKEFFDDFTFEEFFNKYIKLLIVLCNASSDKKNFRKTVKNIIKFQTESTKQNLKDTYKKDTERQVVDCVTRSIELYRITER